MLHWREIRRYFSLLLCVAASTACVYAGPRNELRGIWISDPTGFEWSRVIRDVKEAGFNNLFVNFASAGVAFYPSSILPSREPQESLASLVVEAREAGIFVHAKILTFFMYWAPDSQIYRMTDAGRVLLDMQGKMRLQADTPWLDPAQVENRELAQSLVREILTEFDVDGIQLDYVRFYEERDVPESIMDIRRSVLTNFVADTGRLVETIRPEVRYSACVFYDLHRARNEMAQDWGIWAAKNLFTFLVPMNYTTHPKELVKWINRQDRIREGGMTFYSGLGAYLPRMTPEILLEEIKLVRKAGWPGYVMFGYNPDFVRRMLPALKRRHKRL
jgi:uncharacterized lipoprotein YddW (UPF0748 family)